MKKTLSVIMCAVIALCSVLAFAGCTKTDQLKFDVVLITDGGNISDGGYNESAWNGVEEYANEASLSATYYQPRVGESQDILLTQEKIAEYIELAVSKGAKYIVLPGEAFAAAAFEVAATYPQVNFVLLDAYPHAQDDTTMHTVQNVMSVSYDALESGFLAGYTAVAQGNTKLGYIGSVNTADSSAYGAGFVQGAAYAADAAKTPVMLDYADYDSALIDYDYSFTVKAVYDKIENSNKDCFKVVVENGYGSGTYEDGQNVTVYCDEYNADGQKFDHWEAKSNTEGVRDGKVDLSTTKKTQTNLIVADCDCTITAVYADTQDQTSTITVNNTDGSVYKTYVNAVTTDGSGIWVEAPAAQSGMVFDHWETTGVADSIEDMNACATNVKVSQDPTVLTPVYVKSVEPTFDVTVEGGTGSGAYVAGDAVRVIADVPEDGYYFERWTNADSDGNGTGISMDNEFYYDTAFEMVDRYSAIAETMVDSGDTVLFAGGSDKEESIFTAKGTYDFDVNIISEGRAQRDAYTATIKEYGVMAKYCLENFAGGTIVNADASNNGISMSWVSDDEAVNTEYQKVYDALADGTIKLTAVAPGADVRLSYSSKCLSLNYMIKG